MTDGSHHGPWWHRALAGAAVIISSSVGSAIMSHVGGVTSDELKQVKSEITSVAAKQQSDGDVTARGLLETKAQIIAIGAKLDKLSAAVLGKKRRMQHDDP